MGGGDSPEPLQGEGGVRPGDMAYFQRIRKICDETGIC